MGRLCLRFLLSGPGSKWRKVDAANSDGASRTSLQGGRRERVCAVNWGYNSSSEKLRCRVSLIDGAPCCG